MSFSGLVDVLDLLVASYDGLDTEFFDLLPALLTGNDFLICLSGFVY